MSSDLSVKLKRAINLSELLPAVTTAIEELLQIRTIPPLEAFRLDAGLRSVIVSGEINVDGQGFALKLKGFNEAVGIYTALIPESITTSLDESGLWLSIVVSAMRTPLEFAFAAGVAVAFSRLSGSNIVDDALIWTNNIEQTPQDFLAHIRVHHHQPDILTAANQVYATLLLGQGNM